MQVRSFLLTMGAGVAVGALGAMELPSTENPALREILAADKAARELVWAACGK